MYLRRVDLLPDKFEGRATPQTRAALLKALTTPGFAGINLGQAFAEQLVDHWVNMPNGMRRCTYVSCWRIGDYESEAMWRLYCGTGAGAALVLPYEKLRDSLTDERTFIGQVHYINFDSDVIDGGNALNHVMHKRREFEHEHEVRIVKWEAPKADYASPEFLAIKLPESVALPWDPEEWLEKIVVSPYAEPWYVDTLQETVARIAPRLTKRIVGSSMGEGSGGP
jgi:hypothetical protein